MTLTARLFAVACCLLGTLFTLQASSVAAAEPSPMTKGAYLSPMASGVFPTNDTALKAGYGGILGMGYRNDIYAVEIAPTYGQQKPGNFRGVAVNGLLFPFSSLPNLYGIVGLTGLQYFDYKTPAEKLKYSTVHADAGAGYLVPISVGRYDFAVRAEARYRIGRRELKYDDQDIDYSAPRRYADVVANVGLYLPLGLAPLPPPAPEPVKVLPATHACSDGLDNDGDGKIDYPADPGCTSAEDDDEKDPPACSDGIDNDGDGLIDFPADKGCSSADDNDETDPCKKPAPGERISLKGCGSGDVIVLNGVSFEFDKARLTPNARTILDNVADELTAYGDIVVEIAGHTDAKGSDEYNQRLSELRAESVMHYLAKKGIAASRMTAVGYGESKPVADNDTDEGRELNRRVELRITSGTTTSGDQTANPAPPSAAEPVAPATPPPG